MAAAALGACVIEKYLTLDPSMPGPDHNAGIDQVELKALVDGARRIATALGGVHKLRQRPEEEIVRISRKNLVVARPVRAREAFSWVRHVGDQC